MVFSIGLLGPGGIDAGLDRAAVLVSLSEPSRWIFSTAYTGYSAGHPVSGNREFGYFQDRDSYVFYTRAADRPTTAFLDYVVGEVVQAQFKRALQSLGLDSIEDTVTPLFDGGDKIWRHFQNAIATHVTQQGGTAIVEPPVVRRTKWENIEAFFNPTTPINRPYVGFAIEPPPGIRLLDVIDIDSTGQFLGRCMVDSLTQGCLFKDANSNGNFADDAWRYFGAEGGTPYPQTISEDTILGYSETSEGNEIPFTWTATNYLPSQVSIPGAVSARIVGKWNTGLVGSALLPVSNHARFTEVNRAFLVSKDGAITWVDGAYVKAIYSDGGKSAVFESDLGDSLIWNGTEFRTPRKMSPEVQQIKVSQTNRNEICGHAIMKNGARRAVIGSIDAPTLIRGIDPKKGLAFCSVINAKGEAAGWSESSSGPIPVVFSKKTGMEPLDALMQNAVSALSAVAIGDRGEIVVRTKAKERDVEGFSVAYRRP